MEETIARMARAKNCRLGEVLQTLWSGYGVIQRVHFDGGPWPTAIVKHVDLSKSYQHPRGWSGEIGHQRKVRSYAVETEFYQTFSQWTDDRCRVPQLIGVQRDENDRPSSNDGHEHSGWLILLEDLDSAGFSSRKQTASLADVEHGLKWLANFHGTFIGVQPDGLWPIGSYWHLETRQAEWDAMESGPLKTLALRIDQHLNQCRYQTLIHGDAKLANFCFAPRSDQSGGQSVGIAAVDFQYVGGGCGIKDVAYFISSIADGYDSGQLSAHEEHWLSFYFEHLHRRVNEPKGPSQDIAGRPKINFAELEAEWRHLYRYAWADFSRFLIGWAPGHWKLNPYANRLTQTVIEELNGGD